jgi:trypsin-like peptidase
MRPSHILESVVLMFASACNLMGQSGKATVLTGDQVVERVTPSAVVILVGRGDGQVAGMASGVIIRPDGVILTANHVVKGMREVQVRLKNGEVYDQVELIASDERRDIAALRIPAVGLPVLAIGSYANTPSGAQVFAISNAAGLPWTASSGILSAIRMADEVPGAGSGYRLVQFTAPSSPGSSGAVLVDTEAKVLGIIVGSYRVGQNINFAVPLESVAGLATGSGGTRFDSGARLQPPTTTGAETAATPARPPSVPAAPPDLSLPRPDQLPIRTLSVLSKTIYLRRERLQEDLRKTALFQQLGVRFADYAETADVSIIVDRPVLTFDWTYTLVYQPSSLTLALGTIEGADEFEAAPKLAAQIMERLADTAVLPRGALAKPRPTRSRDPEASRHTPIDPAEVLRTARTIFVESHTVWMKGNLLQDALYVRPELHAWGIRMVDDRASADIYIDVTRPFLTYDWIFKMVSLATGTVVGTGRVPAIDGPAAAQRLAMEIVGCIRSARPLPATKAP